MPEVPRKTSRLCRSVVRWVVGGSITISELAAQTPAIGDPPVAPVFDHRETRHGATVVDNYFWVREKSNPEVIRYLEAENSYTEAQTRRLQPFTDVLYKEMLSR